MGSYDDLTADEAERTALEAIVRALAKVEPLAREGYNDEFTTCTLCEVTPDEDWDQDLQPAEFPHAENCPWLRAKAWVEANPEATGG